MGRTFMAVSATALLFIVAFFTGVMAADKTPEDLVKEAKAVIKEVSIDDVKKMIDGKEKVIILDIRDKEEYLAGHIPGAVNMSRGLLDFHVHEIIPDKEARVVLYWIYDLRSPLATKSMNDLGYRDAVNMKGGLKAWKEAGYPVTGKQ